MVVFLLIFLLSFRNISHFFMPQMPDSMHGLIVAALTYRPRFKIGFVQIGVWGQSPQ